MAQFSEKGNDRKRNEVYNAFSCLVMEGRKLDIEFQFNLKENL